MKPPRLLLSPQPELSGDGPAGAPALERPSAPEPERPAAEDASTQALEEALRSSFRIVKVLMIGLVIVFVASGVFTVKPNEVAVRLRFGKPAGVGAEQLLQPGLHWALPAPIDEIVRIPVGQSHSVRSTVGWYQITPEEEQAGNLPPPRPTLVPGADGYTLTADGNILHVRATVRYRISDPLAYAFNFANFSNLLQNVVNEAILHASARFTADQALYEDKAAFKEAVLQRVQTLIERQGLGVSLEPSEVEVAAPLEVRQAFEAVLQAQQDRSKSLNQAQGDADQLLQEAAAERQSIIAQAHSASNQLVLSVRAQADYFLSQRAYYEKDPELFRQRVLLERLAPVLTNAEYKFLIPPEAGGQPTELRLQLNRVPERKRVPTTQP
jgi:membrane protease subunit HflK